MVESSKMYTLRFWTKAGGGGGHEIHLKDIKAELSTDGTPEDPTCQDSDNGAVDPYGTGCEAYTANPNWCGG